MKKKKQKKIKQNKTTNALKDDAASRHFVSTTTM